MYTYFSSHTKTKLKFNPDVGTDVALPQPNPVTQYLPTNAGSPDSDIITGQRNMPLSTAPSSQYPSTSSILKGTPASSTAGYKIPSAPLASPFASEPVVEAGRTKPEMSTLNTKSMGDTRKTLDSRAMTKGLKSRSSKPGLLGGNPSKNYYRQVLGAI